MAGYTPRWFTRPQAVTHPSVDQAQCRLTRLIEANALTTTLRRHCEYLIGFSLFVENRTDVWFTAHDNDV